MDCIFALVLLKVISHANDKILVVLVRCTCTCTMIAWKLACFSPGAGGPIVVMLETPTLHKQRALCLSFGKRYPQAYLPITDGVNLGEKRLQGHIYNAIPNIKPDEDSRRIIADSKVAIH